jgi:hypothetical protein
MFNTFNTLLTQNPGYDTANLLAMQMPLPESRHPGASQYSDFYRCVLQRLSQMETAQSAAVEASLGYAQGLHIEGRSDPKPDKLTPHIYSVSDRLFKMGSPAMERHRIQ